MNSHDADQWWIVASSKQISSQPFTTRLFDNPLLIIRGPEGPACFLDRCPHRGYPLSEGIFTQKTMQCAYHGWKFDYQGAAIELPGAPDFQAVPDCLKRFAICEAQGYIWVSPGNPGTKAPNNITELDYPYADYCQDIKAARIDIIENFLDALHTHFVHTGIVRTKRKRHRCQVQVETIVNGYQATYREEKQQSGWLSRAFGGHIVTSIGRVMIPGQIQIDYCSNSGVEMRVSIWVSPVSESHNRLFMRTYIKPGKLPFWLKRVVLFPILSHVFQQDKKVLETLADSLQGSDFKPIVTRSDVMRHCIDNVLNHKLPPVDKKLDLEL